MPSIPLHTQSSVPLSTTPNPLPQVLHTPAGIAIIELQGSLNLPSSSSQSAISVGRIVFPPASSSPTDTSWYKQIYLYIGANQRMSGELKKLSKPIAVVQKRNNDLDDDELEILQIVKYKILFSGRPEPVGSTEMPDGGENEVKVSGEDADAGDHMDED